MRAGKRGRGRARARLGAALLVQVSCAHPPAPSPEARALRVGIVQPAYGAHPTHPAALAPGEQLALDQLALADGGALVLGEALAAGPVVLVWVGGEEHEALSAWVQSLDAALPELEARGASLVFVRSLEVESALRWAIDLRLQTTVACDLDAQLGAALDLLRLPDRGELPADFAALILDAKRTVVYRKLGGRRPQLEELLAVLDGEGGTLACCPGACVGEPCVALSR